MIDTTYAVNCLKQGFQRYIMSNRINATIDCGDNYVSFYVNNVNGKQYIARGSDHHLKMQHLADKDKPWNGDNISIVFITPNSPQDIRIRGRVRQTHYGSIKPFSVTTYKYDNTILDERDLHQIFNAILSFLNGNGYTDPFAKTPKAASVIPINANIKPYKEPTRKARNISVDKDGNYVSANAWGADYVSESSNNNRINSNRNMNKKAIQLTEEDLHNIVENVVSNMLNGMGIGQQQQGQQTQQTQSQQQTQQQPQQQQGQQQNNNQITAYQQALTNYLNKMGTYMAQQFQELNRNVSIIQQQIRALNQRTPNSNSNM